MFRKSILGLGMLLLPFALFATDPGKTPGNDPKSTSGNTDATSTEVVAMPLQVTAIDQTVTVRLQAPKVQGKTLVSVQRSTDGEQWVPVFTIKCENSGSVHSIFDRDMAAGLYQYRLRSIDLEGSVYYSTPTSVEVAAKRQSDATVPGTGSAFGLNAGR